MNGFIEILMPKIIDADFKLSWNHDYKNMSFLLSELRPSSKPPSSQLADYMAVFQDNPVDMGILYHIAPGRWGLYMSSHNTMM